MRTRAKLGIFVAVALGLPAGAFLWFYLATRPPSHAMCVEQADHEAELFLGDRLREEQTEYPRDYEHFRNSSITACDRYWSRRYVQCRLDAPTYAEMEQCEAVGRVR